MAPRHPAAPRLNLIPTENEKMKAACILKTVFTIVGHLPISAM